MRNCWQQLIGLTTGHRVIEERIRQSLPFGLFRDSWQIGFARVVTTGSAYSGYATWLLTGIIGYRDWVRCFSILHLESIPSGEGEL